jgi:geranylgeranyl diphosphate synthase type I
MYTPSISPAQSRSLVDTYLTKTLATRVSEAKKVGPAYAALWQTIQSLVLPGGKRTRPHLAHLAFTGAGGEGNAIVPAMAALEVLHFALLVHDDIIDRDEIRYGQANIAGRYRHTYADSAEAGHFAQGAALMAGDALISLSYKLLDEVQLPAEQKQLMRDQLSQSIFQVCGGELMDMEAAIPALGQADSLAIAHYKTASYSFVAPLTIGALAAGAPRSTVTALERAGVAMGICYQLADDLVGLYGTAEEIGKPVASDLREGKQTWLFQFALDHLTTDDKAAFLLMWGNPQMHMDDVQRARDLMEKCGARQQTILLMRRYAQESRNLLDQHLEPKAGGAVLALLDACMEKAS